MERLFASPVIAYAFGIVAYVLLMPLYSTEGVITLTGFLSLLGFGLCLAYAVHAVSNLMTGEEDSTPSELMV